MHKNFWEKKTEEILGNCQFGFGNRAGTEEAIIVLKVTGD